jgi:ribosomal protein S18 acetylase RimI-like enzyme
VDESARKKEAESSEMVLECYRVVMHVRVSIANPEADSGGIESLLREVYVEGGFTDAAVAESAFAAPAVFSRGRVLVAHDPETNKLAGMVIVVPATSSARRFATSGEVEMHLLAVASEFRRMGVGDLLVRSALDSARNDGAQKMILWTQVSMTDAQRLYERSQFERNPNRDFEKSGRQFLVFERRL